MNLTFLNTFLAVATHGNFTVASKALFITQPAVSQHIKALEKSLDVSLFIRSGRGVILTDDGKVLQKKTEEIMNSLKDLEGYFNDKNELQKGSMTIGMTELGTYLLSPFFYRFKLKYPGVKLKMIGSTTAKVVKMVSSGDIDLGIARNISLVSRQIKLKKFYTESIVFVAQKNHALSKEKIILPEMLANEVIALREMGTITRDCVLEWTKSNSFISSSIIEANSMHALRELAINGCLAFIPESIVRNDIKNGVLVSLPTNGLNQKIDYYCYTRSNDPPSKATQAFLRMISDSGTGIFCKMQ